MGEIIAGTPGPQPVRLKHLFFILSTMTYPISDIDGLPSFAASKTEIAGHSHPRTSCSRAAPDRKRPQSACHEDRHPASSNCSNGPNVLRLLCGFSRHGQGKGRAGCAPPGVHHGGANFALRNPARSGAEHERGEYQAQNSSAVFGLRKSRSRQTDRARRAKLQPKITYLSRLKAAWADARIGAPGILTSPARTRAKRTA